MAESTDYKIILERGGVKLLYMEGPIDMIAPAAIGLLQRETGYKKLNARIGQRRIRYTEEETEKLVDAVKAGKVGKQLRSLFPTRAGTSLWSRLQHLAENKTITAAECVAAQRGIT